MKTFPLHLTLIATVVAITTPIAIAAESLSVLLQKGIFAEETEGNVDAAIKIYEQVATEAAANHALGAQAQFRLAVCYQKKGNKEQAIKLLTDLAEQFTTDANIAKKSKETLVALGVDPAGSPSVRRISLPLQTDWIVSISANGRFIAYEPRDTSDLAVSDVVSGKTWTIFKGTKGNSIWAAWLSPDGQWIAYQTSALSITASKNDGSETRVLYKAAGKEENCWMYDWAPDGRQIWLWIYNPDPKMKLAMAPIYSLDLTTGAKREVVRTPTKAGKGRWIISPDKTAGLHVTEDYPRRIGLWDLKTGTEEVLLNREAGDVFGWFAGGTKVLYSKRGPEGVDLLAVAVKDAKPVGQPEQIWRFAGEAWAGRIGEDGSIYYSAPRDSFRVRGSDDLLWALDGLLNRRAPVASSGTEIPPEDILGPGNTIVDRKFALSFTFPKDWGVLYASRMEREQSGGIGFRVPTLSTGFVRLYYAKIDKDTRDWMPSDLKPSTASATAAWLHEYARGKAVQRAEQEHLNDFKNRPESIISRMIGRHQALSWSADFLRNNEKWTEYHTVVCGKDTFAQFWITCPAVNVDVVKPAFESMVETLHLP